MKDFKDLRIWQQGMDIAVDVYKLMELMPKEEKYSLTSQIKRAVISVPSNISEGQARGTKEFLHFLRITQGSLAELETQMILTNRLGMLNEEEVNNTLENIIALKKRTSSMMNYLKTLIDKQKKG